MSDVLWIECSGLVLILWLNCFVFYNVFDVVLIVQLIVVLEVVGCDVQVCVVVLVGQGVLFLVGVDMQWMCGMVVVSEEDNCQDLLVLVCLMCILDEFFCLIIVCVYGVVFGGGVGLVVCCDIVIVSISVCFGLIESWFGLLLVVIFLYVIDVIGLCQVCCWFVIGEYFDVEIVLCIGLVYQLIEFECIDEVVQCQFSFFDKVGLIVLFLVKDLVCWVLVGCDCDVFDCDNVVLIVCLWVLVEGQEGLGVFLDKCVFYWVIQD